MLRLIALAQRHEGAGDAAMNRQSFVDCKRAAGPTLSLRVDNGRIASTAAEAAGVAARHGAHAQSGCRRHSGGFVIGKHSGLAAVNASLSDLDLQASPSELDAILARGQLRGGHQHAGGRHGLPKSRCNQAPPPRRAVRGFADIVQTTVTRGHRLDTSVRPTPTAKSMAPPMTAASARQSAPHQSTGCLIFQALLPPVFTARSNIGVG